jgi:hypothetical protein
MGCRIISPQVRFFETIFEEILVVIFDVFAPEPVT